MALLFASALSHAQDEVELFGEWFLNYRTFGPTTIYPPLTTSEDYNVILNFSLLPPTASHPFVIESYGPTASTYEGRFEVENGIMEIFNVEETTQNCEHPQMVCSFFDDYNNDILFDPDTIIESGEHILAYEITETGENAILTIINESNGERAVYGRQPPIHNDITGNWFVQSITTDNVQHDNYVGEISINFTETPWAYENSFDFSGESGCNGYVGAYSLLSETTISFLDWVASASCGSDAYGRYYNKFSDIIELSFDPEQPIPMNYDIVGTGLSQELIITNSEGDFIVFGKEVPTITIFKTWYSYSTETADGIIYPSPLDSPTLNISTQETTPYGMEISGNGGCNDFFATHNIYSSNENELWIYLFNQTLVICDDNTYEPTYLSVISDEANAIFGYEIHDQGETLILTNEIGEVLTFGNQAPPTTDFLGEWMLHYLLVEGNQIWNPSNTIATINFEDTPSIDTSDGFILSGNGACNSFFGDYHLNPTQSFTMKNFSSTLSLCDTSEEDTFEINYFSNVLIDGFDDEIELQYDLSGTGDDATLIITNPTNGNQAIYGRQALSLEENAFLSLSVTLNQNPVDHLLSFTSNNVSNDHYEVYTITGKLLSKGILSSNTINVSQLPSGLYFLKIFNDQNNFETLKFIKK